MNCPNCGAPLTWLPGRSVMNCEHCRSFHQPLLDARFADRLLWQHEPTDHDCPHCQSPLEAAVLDDFPAEACRECAGVLLADDVFAQVVRTRRANYRGADRTPLPLDPDFAHAELPCPGCGKPMDVHPYCGPGNQMIDSCFGCGLIWLDTGELSAIEQSPGRR